jgi:hypothetical protein
MKMAILPKTIYRINTMPIKISMLFIIEREKSILKFLWKNKRLPISKANLRKRAMLETL